MNRFSRWYRSPKPGSPAGRTSRRHICRAMRVRGGQTRRRRYRPCDNTTWFVDPFRFRHATGVVKPSWAKTPCTNSSREAATGTISLFLGTFVWNGRISRRAKSKPKPIIPVKPKPIPAKPKETPKPKPIPAKPKETPKPKPIPAKKKETPVKPKPILPAKTKKTPAKPKPKRGTTSRAEWSRCEIDKPVQQFVRRGQYKKNEQPSLISV